MTEELVLVYGRPQAECDREYRAYMLAHLSHQQATPLLIDFESTSEQVRHRVVVSRPTRQLRAFHLGKQAPGVHPE